MKSKLAFKNLILIIAVFFISIRVSFSQTVKDITVIKDSCMRITLTNGSKWQGVVISQTDTTLCIRTDDEVIRSYRVQGNKIKVLRISKATSTVAVIPAFKIYPDLFSLWITADGGCSSFGTNLGYVVNSTAYVEVKRYLFSVGYNKSSETNFPDGAPGFFQTKPENTITYNSARLCGGIVFPGKVFFSISAGLSFSSFNYTYQTLVTTYSTVNVPILFFGTAPVTITNTYIIQTNNAANCIGIPIEIKMHLFPKRTFGMDLGFTADINSQNSLFGCTLGLRIGRIKHK